MSPKLKPIERTVENLERLLAAYRDHVQEMEGHTFVDPHRREPSMSSYLTVEECDYIYGLEESPVVD